MADQGSLRVATNIDLLIGGNLKRRDALVKLCDVSSNTVGLYASDGILRTVCPGGQSLQDTRPTEIWYDPIGDGAAVTLGSLSKLHAMEVMAASTGGKGYPYVVIETTAGRFEHHWLNSDPATAAAAVNTKVVLPFDPGKCLVKSKGKLFADEPSTGLLRFSAATTNPKDWTKARDAGFLAVRAQSAGSRDIVSLSYYRSYVSVVFQDSIQLWQMDADPARHEFITSLNGPGTETARLTQNVLGDMFYFSRGGFRSLSRSSVNSDDLAEDIGARIASETKAIDTTAVTPVALWSESRSQYIAALGTTVYVMTYSPSTQTTGWTKWTLPVAPEHIVENAGKLYIRAANTVYVFEPNTVNDTAGTINYDVYTAYQHLGYPGAKKRWAAVDLVQTGTCALNVAIDPADTAEMIFPVGLNITDTTFSGGKIAIDKVSDTLALRFTGSGIWRLDSAILDAKVLRGRG
jgi:hypothetical protein